MGMGRRRRNETVACECKRKAEADEAPDIRHEHKLQTICYVSLNKHALAQKRRDGNYIFPLRRRVHALVRILGQRHDDTRSPEADGRLSKRQSSSDRG
jgi:hypothetical protein